MDHEKFLAELFPRLEAACRVERELDRKTAHRFNVLDYLRRDELGLSRIIADLLDPKAKHGQGTLFLSTLLELDGVKEVVRWPSNLDSCRTTVDKERKTADGRSIDISVEIVDAGGTRYCLAIENKPFAADQPKQVLDYLEFLKDKAKYDDRFLLIYLSATGEGPSEDSIDTESLREWKQHLAIMAYSASPAKRHDEFNEIRTPCTLADWLRRCRRICDVDHLRWFLGDAEKFCKQTFGDLTMSSDIERKTIRDFVLSDRRNLESAFAVYRAWPIVKDEICEWYLKHLCNRIRVAVREDESLKQFAEGTCVDCIYVDKSPYMNSIYLYRKSWAEYCVEGSSATLRESVTRTTIAMNNAASGPSGWGVGVASPISVENMHDGDRKRRDCLVEKFKQKFDSARNTEAWPWWRPLDEHKGDWSSLILELEEECKRDVEVDKQGVTAYFVGEFLSIARRAMPIIDEVEGRGCQ